MTSRRQLVLLGIALITLFLFPVTSPGSYYLHLLILIFMYGTMASSWNIIGGYAGYISFGHVVFFGVGAYTTAILQREFGLSPFVTAPLAGILASMVAASIGYPSLKTRGAYFAIVTLALCFVGQLITTNLEFTGGGVGISLDLVPWDVDVMKVPFYYGMLLALCATIFISYRIKNSKFGLGLIAIREDEEKAEAVGINTTQYKLLAFVASAFFVGVVGGLYSYYMSYIDPPTVFSALLSINVLIMAIFGGRGTIWGPVIGAIILMLLSEYLLYNISSQVHLIVYGLLLITVVLFLPDGIMSLGKVLRKDASR